MKEPQPEAHILVLTIVADQDKVFPAIQAGAPGYHLNNARPKELVQAIYQAHRSESPLRLLTAHKVLAELSRSTGRLPTPGPLTPRSWRCCG